VLFRSPKSKIYWCRVPPLNLSGAAIPPLNVSGTAIPPLNRSDDAITPVNLSGDAIALLNFSGAADPPLNLSGAVIPPPKPFWCRYPPKPFWWRDHPSKPLWWRDPPSKPFWCRDHINIKDNKIYVCKTLKLRGCYVYSRVKLLWSLKCLNWNLGWSQLPDFAGRDSWVVLEGVGIGQTQLSLLHRPIIPCSALCALPPRSATNTVQFTVLRLLTVTPRLAHKVY
jgi:hypothetical protein